MTIGYVAKSPIGEDRGDVHPDNDRPRTAVT